MTPAQVGDLIKWILGSFPTQGSFVDKAAMTRAYGAGLMDLDFDDAERAVTELALTESKIPAIATIRARVAAYNHGETRPGVVAWGDVTREVHRVGLARSPTFRDRLVAAAVSDLTWEAICMARVNDAAIRSRFIEHYNHLASKVLRTVQLSHGAKSRTLRAGKEQQRIGGLVRSLLPKMEDGSDDDDDGKGNKSGR